jgi:hypothetical protein
MTDCILIQHGVAQEIWRGLSKESLSGKFPEGLLAMMVEAPAGTVNEGDVWDGVSFAPPVVVIPDVILPYADFRALWTDDEKSALHTARQSNWQIEDFVSLAIAQNSVNLSKPTAAAAKSALVAASVLSADRADIIFKAS